MSTFVDYKYNYTQFRNIENHGHLGTWATLPSIIRKRNTTITVKLNIKDL